MINEKLSPEPLQHQQALISQIQENITEQKKKSKSLSTNIQNATTVNLINLEIQRTEYMLKSYLRTRIQKLEKYAVYYENRLAELVDKCGEDLDVNNLQEEDKADFEFITNNFTDEELDFIRETSLNDKNLMEKVVVDNVPNCEDLGLRDDLREKLGTRYLPPDLDKYSFAEILKAEDGEELEVQEINGNLTLVTAKKGDLFILPYRSIKEKVDKGE